MESLKDVYIHQLQDLHSANRQALKATRELSGAATNEHLSSALKRGVEGIEDGLAKLEELIRAHGGAPNGEHCKGMEGLVREARSHALKEEFAVNVVRDAVIITQYQRMAHYAIAGYGCAIAFAKQLDLAEDATTLSEMLDAAYSGDRTMSELAEKQINARAA
jgi:ferritin-like metal-binding protein YciE